VTTRGGLLLKGLGISVNDVSVVTNVSADHLGLQGIETVDQLAEVKAIVTKITKPTGWVVLNGDDPRVWAMRVGLRARPWVFSLDPDSPALRESLNLGGRGITVLDGDVVVLQPHADPDHLAPIVDVPMTLSGLSAHDIANALAATAAALGLGLPREAVVAGLRTFSPDPRHNPGRMNVYSLPLTGGGRHDKATVIIDFAHNEAGLEGLLRVADGLRPPGAAVHLGLGAGGDRTDEILQGLGELAGRRADRVSAIHKTSYLRGREMEDLEAQLRIGLARVALASPGDVLAVMVHADRVKLDGWLMVSGATVDADKDIRRKVIASRGEHEAESAIAELWAEPDVDARVASAEALAATAPDDPRLIFELAAAYDGAGDEQQAIALYDRALGAGLREPHRHRALLQQAISHRKAGDLAAARRILDPLCVERPGSAAVAAFRALTMLEQGEAPVAVADLINVLLARSSDADDEAYRAALHGHAGLLRSG
jgi:cyanophycin synthetase